MISPLRQAAADILQTMRRQYSGPHVIVPAQEADFPHLDLSAYAGFRSELGQHGFRYIGDIELRDVSQVHDKKMARTMIRAMLSDDGRISAGYYQIRALFWRQLLLLLAGLANLRLVTAPLASVRALKTRHCIDFSTEFSDGRHLITTNAEASAILEMPPSIEKQHFPYGTPAAALLSRHRARLDEIVQQHAGVQPRVMASTDDLVQKVQREKAIKDSYRAALQWITQEELRKMSRGDHAWADAIFAEVRNILAGERSVP